MRSRQHSAASSWRWGPILLLYITVFLFSCANPTAKIIKKSEFQRFSIPTADFELTTYKNSAHTSALHVYFSGDGSPFLQNRYISKDPTPRNPIALNLMALDLSESVFIARPCYYLDQPSINCHWSLWTTARYSEAVVTAMTQALQSLLTENRYTSVTLIGFSGGGVLATLVGERIQEVSGVITIAANLDTDLWTTMLHFSPLQNSLNPNKLPALRQDILRIHLMAVEDKTVPNQVTESFALMRGGERRYFEGFDHHCCWHNIWPQFLSELANRETPY